MEKKISDFKVVKEEEVREKVSVKELLNEYNKSNLAKKILIEEKLHEILEEKLSEYIDIFSLCIFRNEIALYINDTTFEKLSKVNDILKRDGLRINEISAVSGYDYSVSDYDCEGEIVITIVRDDEYGGF